jgi:hypothetical protein
LWDKTPVLQEIMKYVAVPDTADFMITKSMADPSDGLLIVEVQCEGIKIDGRLQPDNRLSKVLRSILKRFTRIPKRFTRVRSRPVKSQLTYL